MQLIEQKNKYRPTIGNISSLVIFCFAVYFMIYSGPMGFGFLAGMGLIMLCAILMLIDFLFQRFIKNYWIISIIELILLIGIFVCV